MKKKYSLRFNPDPTWNVDISGNRYFIGLYEMCKYIAYTHQGRENMKLLEIGSYMGESTFIFASHMIFDEIHCIEPFDKDGNIELFNEMSDRTWDEVKREFWTNTRHWDNISLHNDFSYNIHDNFADESFDVIYIDGGHEYAQVMRDLELYYPKLKPGGIICGHDYAFNFPELVKAVDKFFGKQPEMHFQDSSWAFLAR